MLVYISQMVPYFSLFDTFMDQTQDSSIIAAADTDAGKPNILNKTGFLTFKINQIKWLDIPLLSLNG